MNLGLKSKTALVSGSTAGIGLAVAATLAAEGAKVIFESARPSSLLKRFETPE